jgi:hypothetical protein
LATLLLGQFATQQAPPKYEYEDAFKIKNKYFPAISKVPMTPYLSNQINNQSHVTIPFFRMEPGKE